MDLVDPRSAIPGPQVRDPGLGLVEQRWMVRNMRSIISLSHAMSEHMYDMTGCERACRVRARVARACGAVGLRNCFHGFESLW